MDHAISGLRTVIYKVADLQAAKKWYTDVFEREPYFDQPFYVGFNIDGYELGLQPEDKIVPEKVESVAAYWAATDIHAIYEKLLLLGARANESPQNVGEGIIVATVKDPWDNVIGLIHNPHFKL